MFKRYQSCRVQAYRNVCNEAAAEWDKTALIKYYDLYNEKVNCDIGKCTLNVLQNCLLWLKLIQCIITVADPEGPFPPPPGLYKIVIKKMAAERGGLYSMFLALPLSKVSGSATVLKD